MAVLIQRRARRLRLTAADEGMVRRGVLLLEDALRTMSPPGGERPLFVRTLYLPHIDSEKSPAALALQIETQLRQLTRTAVYAASPQAQHAAAVFFQDDAEPGEQLALRLVQRQPVDAWFWPLAVPGWQPQMPLDQAMRHIIRFQLQTQAGPAATARLVLSLHIQASAAPLLAALRPSEGAALLRAFGWALPTTTPSAVTSTMIPPPAWAGVLRQWLPYWGVTDARTYWLVSLALAAPQLHLLAMPARPAQVHPLITKMAQEMALPTPIATPPHLLDISPVTNLTSTPRPTVLPLSPLPPTAATPPAPVKAVGKRKKAVATPLAPLSKPADAPATPLLYSFSDQLPTQAGGLFFLIPVLARLGMAEAMDSQPHLAEMSLPWHFLRMLCHHLAVPDEDSIWHAVPPLPPLIHSPFITPTRWRHSLWTEGATRLYRALPDGWLLQDSSGRLPLAYWQGKAPSSVGTFMADERIQRSGVLMEGERPFILTAWLTAVRRWCRRIAQVGLRHIVQRPGAITITPTHLELFFDHRQADIQIRRAGLDLNPGWVPWLGRVITFHYQYGND